MEQRNVVSLIVKNDLCIGCGVCAGVCPSGNLKMKWNEYGEYNPSEEGVCVRGCSLCLMICPFGESKENEDSLGNKLFGNFSENKHTEEVGFYDSCFVGYTSSRVNSASGGMATYVMEILLQKGFVDKVISVHPTGDSDCLFEFRVISTLEEVRKSAGSVYYPVHLENIIKYILENPGNYAVIGLPCFVKALRLASQVIPKLRDQIRFILGLVCGQLKSSFYTRYIAMLAGVDENLKTCYFRSKDPHQPAGNFAFTCEGVSGKKGSIRWNEGVSKVWSSRWFTPTACNFCDDIFAELADITFMDAWLPEYCQDTEGTSLIIIRNPEIRSILEVPSDLVNVFLEPIPISSIIASQAGVVSIKRKQIAYRLYKASQRRIKLPIKRVISSKHTFHPLERKEIEVLDAMQSTSRQSVMEKKQGKINCKEIRDKLEVDYAFLKKIHLMKGIMRLPIRIMKKISRFALNSKNRH